MIWIITGVLIGSSFSIFIMPKLIIWTAQGVWCTSLIWLGFGWSFFEIGKPIKLPNKPLGMMFLWVTMFSTFWIVKSMYANKYDIHHFVPWLCFFTGLLFYRFIVQYLNTQKILKILGYMRYMVILTLGLCVLQYFGYAQFFRMLFDDIYHTNPVVGFLGNGTHLSGFLASTIPIFLFRGKREDYLALALMGCVMCTTGTTLNDPAISGFIVAIVVWLFFFKNNLKVLIPSVLVLGGIGVIAYLNLPKQFFCGMGRLKIWHEYLVLAKPMAITGSGLGSVQILSKFSGVPTAKHLHNEYIQFTFEMGLIGGVLLLNLVKKFFEDKAGNRLQLCLKTMVVGFLVSSCFNYPAHLWLPVTWAIFAYGSLHCLKNEEKLYGQSIH